MSHECADVGSSPGETRAVLLVVAGGESSDPTPLRDVAADLGPAGADGLTCSERHGARLAKKEHKHGEVSEKCPQNQIAYGQFDLDVDPADGLGSLKDMQRKKYGAADVRGYIKGAHPDGQNGNPG